MNEDQIEAMKSKIIETIREIRARHGACTARAVAGHLRYKPDAVRYRCQELQNENRVNWTSMPGSLHVVEDMEQELFEAKVLALALEDPALVAKARGEKPPAKKRAAKKRAAKRPASEDQPADADEQAEPAEQSA